MHLIQFEDAGSGPSLGRVVANDVWNVTRGQPAVRNIAAAFLAARAAGLKLSQWLEQALSTSTASDHVSYDQLLAEGRVGCPVASATQRILVTGTGLTHLGSVQQRDAMHKAADAAAPLSDSRKMFELGRAGGRPAAGERGAAPEWFYKGDGGILRGPGQTLEIPPFAPDGGEEPELAGVYIIDERGVPCRLGFVQGNEWSDHVTENINYLYLAPSKLRQCAIGPELITDLNFSDVRGVCRVRRNGAVIYDSGELLSGEEQMCHSLANLEDHHFKFPQHRVPGDIHVHFFGTCKLSFKHRDWQYATGDEIEVAFAGCGRPLQNIVTRTALSSVPVRIEPA